MAATNEPKIEEEVVNAGDNDGGAPDMAGLEEMMAGMGGIGGGDGGAGGMDMSALMSMLGKGGGKGGGGMEDMMGGMGGMGGKGGGKGQRKDDTDEKPGGEKWFWQQKGEEIQIRIPCDPPVTKKDVSVKFKSTNLAITVRGESIVEGILVGKVEVDECTWVLSPDKSELQVMLTQVAGKTDAWPSLLA